MFIILRDTGVHFYYLSIQWSVIKINSSFNVHNRNIGKAGYMHELAFNLNCWGGPGLPASYGSRTCALLYHAQRWQLRCGTMDGCVLGYPIAGFSYPLPAGKKMPAEAKKNARQALEENEKYEFLFFHHYNSNLGGVGNARRALLQDCDVTWKKFSICTPSPPPPVVSSARKGKSGVLGFETFDLHPPPGRAFLFATDEQKGV